MLAEYATADDLRRDLLIPDLTSEHDGRAELVLDEVEDLLRTIEPPDTEPTVFHTWAAAAGRGGYDRTVIIDAYSTGGDNCLTFSDPKELREQAVVFDRVETCVELGQVPVIADTEINVVGSIVTLTTAQKSARRHVMDAMCTHAANQSCITNS